MKKITEEQIEIIDDLLSKLEDFMHGDIGDEITNIRYILNTLESVEFI